mmetsp:Transcript_26777/g.73602  ORF Transcript_26777/g.73602 Transcript_26777/m.73602 type:complete len:126 (-) Transcript_26777:89-466(-)
MARRGARRTGLALGMSAAAVFWAVHWASTTFVQPRAPKNQGIDIAALGAIATLSASLPAEALKGPLAGSEVCSSKPLVWLIYPLCDPVFLAAPQYLAPLLLIFYGGITTIINLLIPATQPDEDLR